MRPNTYPQVPLVQIFWSSEWASGPRAGSTRWQIRNTCSLRAQLRARASPGNLRSGLASASTTTGSSTVESPGGKSPVRYARRHRNTWLAFTPSACATRATLAPGNNVGSTIRRLSSTDHRLRPIGQASTMKPDPRQRGTSHAYARFDPPLNRITRCFGARSQCARGNFCGRSVKVGKW